MAKKKDDGEAKGGGPKKFAVPIVCVLLGVFVGPKVMGGGGAAGADPNTTTTTAPGPVVTMDSTTLNLADGHLLKIGIALQISASWQAEHAADAAGEEEAASTETADPTHGYARAMDDAISILGGMTYDQLLAPGGKNIARSALEEQLATDYEGEIESVLFYEFVMQ